MPDFSIPLSGLTAESTALSAISNNLSNQRTTGYKDTSALFTQGSVSATGVPTDVAIQGSGFFAVENASGVVDYTRAGDFSVDANNYLVTSGGQQVLGYPAV